MIKEEIFHRCKQCQCVKIQKNGKTFFGKQKYYCKNCGSYGVLKPFLKGSKFITDNNADISDNCKEARCEEVYY